MSGIDFTRYQPPGVYTEAVPGPQVPVQAATPTAVGIFGLGQGFESATESLVIVPDADENTGGLNASLRHTGVTASSVKVSNPYTGTSYAPVVDYTVKQTSPGTASSSSTYTIERVVGGAITVGSTVTVQYQYTDPTYFTPRTYFDYSDVQAAYGAPFDPLGNITSELTLACRFAFLNGAQRVVAVAVNPANPLSPTLADYTTALNKLNEEHDVSIVVPANGMQSLQSVVAANVRTQSLGQAERRAILGEDGTVTAVASSQRMDDAKALNSSRVALVSPATFNYVIPESGKSIVVGGQYMAAAIAGLAMTQLAAVPLTRKIITGFSGVAEKVTTPQKNLETQSGLMVVELNQRGTIQIRHGVTTAPSTTQSREWSITGQQDAMVYRVRDYLGVDGLIGGVISDLTLVNIKASVDTALRSLIDDQTIYGFGNLKVRQKVSQPDVVEVAFDWRPSMPLNYLSVSYSIAVESGTVANTDENDQ